MKKSFVFVIALILCFSTLCIPSGALEPPDTVTIDSYDRYLYFKENHAVNWDPDFDTPIDQFFNIPDNFVYYEQISQFGEFDELSFYKVYKDDYIKRYDYDLIDANGHKISISISHNREYYLNEIPLLSEKHVNPRNMIDTTSDSSARREYIYEGIRYIYPNGANRLQCIEWCADGLFYRIFVPKDITFDNTTALGKLLNLNTAKEIIPNAETPPLRDRYVSNDMETFLGDWRDALKGETNKNIRLLSDEPEIIVPILKTSAYELSFIEINNKRSGSYWYYYRYHYEPIGHDKEYVPTVKGIDVYVYPENSYAYDSLTDHIVEWEFINDQEVEVDFPNEVHVYNKEDFNKYFEFEIIDVFDAPVDEKAPSWKVPLIASSCAAVVIVAALGTVIVVKKKKSK